MWRVERRWYAVAVLLPGAVVGTALITDALLYDVSTPTPSFDLLPLFIGSIVPNMLIRGGLEEIGWRGFALPRLQVKYGALTASLLLGVIWIGWHAPLFVVPGAIQSELSPLPFLLQGFALAVVFTYTGRFRADGILGGSVPVQTYFEGFESPEGLLRAAHR